MKNSILVIAPHPDDETLGCGGMLFKSLSEGSEVHWVIVTKVSQEAGFSEDIVARRANEIEAIANTYEFKSVHQLNFSTTHLDIVPLAEIISAISSIVHFVLPDTVLVPYRNDAHSDHERVFDAALAAVKSFRAPFVKKIYAYETLSETEFSFKPDHSGFRPNMFFDISGFLQKKIDAMKIYHGEMGRFPFPRSEECIRAQALLRGSQAGVSEAEAFMLIKEIR